MTAGGHGFDGVERRGLMFVLSSPSGAGKTTLSGLMIERMPDLKMSVSATTRPMRPGEVDGRDYHFIDKAKFDSMLKRHELLESAVVFQNLYGTPRAPVEAALSGRIARVRVSFPELLLIPPCASRARPAGRTGLPFRYRLAGQQAIGGKR